MQPASWPIARFPLFFFPERKVWDVKDLDRWIESLKEDGRPSDDDLLDQLGA
ncbi:hypothetical protein [Pseudovibrio denitrificans]|uniref:hypothetical protein n=1 Tax=Pseudovibrio denitrificans TaxID=258256 RepID=UPI000A552CE2|nr:hypothetical protein [Pseudovibrio denitrificans]